YSAAPVRRGPVLALVYAGLFDHDHAVHVRVDRANIFVGARLIKDEGVLFAAVEPRRSEEAWLSDIDDVVGLLVLIEPGDCGARRDRQRRRLKGKVLDVDLGRTCRGL